MHATLIGLVVLLMTAGTAHAYVPALTELTFAFLLNSGLAVSINAAGIGIYAAAQAIAAAVVVVGGVAVALATRRTPGQPVINPGQVKETFEEPEGPELNVLGYAKLGGLNVFGRTTGSNRYRLPVHCRGAVDGFETLYLNGREIVVNENGHVKSPPYSLPGDNSYINIQSKVGDGTETAWSDLMTDFPDLWTADHRVQGVAQSLILYRNPGLATDTFLQIYQNGLPEYQTFLRGPAYYDPRTETSEWSDNGILACLHVMLRLPGFALSRFDTDFIADEADRADELVATLTGTEKRSRVWGVWPADGIERGAVVEDVLQSAGAEIVARPNDKLGIALIDDDRTTNVTIPLRHLVDFDWASGPENVERPNMCRVFYYSPERDFELAEVPIHQFDEMGEYIGPAWARIEDEIDRVGEQVLEVKLPFCPSASQAQRIARRLFSAAISARGVAKTNFVGVSAWGQRAIDLEFPDDLGTHTLLIATPRDAFEQGQIEIPYVVQPTLTEWNPAADEAPAPDAIPEAIFGSGLTQPDAPTGVTVVTYPGGGGTVTRMGFNMPIDTPYMETAYRTRTDGKPNPWRPFHDLAATQPWIEHDGVFHSEMTQDLTGTPIEVRIRGWNGGSLDGSIWSEVLSVTPAVDNTAPDVPTIDVVYDGPSDTITITTVAPASLNVAYMEFTGSGAPSQTAVEPGEEVEWTVSPTTPSTLYEFTAQAFSTNGTGSSVASDSVTTPA